MWAEQQAFVDEAQCLNVKIVAIESYPKENNRLSRQCLKNFGLHNRNYSTCVPCMKDGALISSHRQQIGWNDVIVMGAGPLHSQELLEIGGEAVEGLFTFNLVFPARSQTPGARSL